MKTFAEIIDAWPSLSDFAADLDIAYVNAQVMRYRDSISADHWSKVEEMAAVRGIPGVTVKLMADIKAERSRIAKASGKPRPRMEASAA